MNQMQDLKMMLLDKFGKVDMPKSIEFCREAYKFLIEGDMMKLVGVNQETGEPIIERIAPSIPKTPELQENEKVTAIDLGLPSGTLWADRNVGAKSQYDYGLFFSWGNTKGYRPNTGDMDWGDFDNAFDYKFTSDEYAKTPGAKLEGDIDLEHDAAHVNMGEPWKMPTAEQFQELYDNCDWIRKNIHGVNGYLVVSKINGNSLFFACSGYGNGTSWDYRGSLGYYWSASFYSARGARILSFNSGGVYPQNGYNRCYGFAVRPVQ